MLLDIERQGLGIAASEIDTVTILKTTVGYEKVVEGVVPPLVPITPTPVVGIKFYVQVFYKLKE